MGDLESSYKKMFTDHIASHHCHEKGKFHESIIHVAIFQIKNSLRLSLPSCTEDWGQFWNSTKFCQPKHNKKTSLEQNCHNRTGTKMGENECRSFRIRSRTSKYWQCLHWFSKYYWLFEGCVIWRLGNTSCNCQMVTQWHQKEIKYWGRKLCSCFMLYNKI